MAYISPALRSTVVARAGDVCEYCRLPQAHQAATFPIDHVVPVVSGGTTELENLALSCPTCNAKKWIHMQGIDALTGDAAPLFNPRLDKWSDHFQWFNDDPTMLVALTPTGRATIALLEFNSTRRRAIRRWLTEIAGD